MNLKRLFFIAAITALMVNTNVFAQENPEHPKYITYGSRWVDLLDTWVPGKAFSTDPNYVDDNFFISRVKLKERFTNVNTQANKTLVNNKDKNIGWWCPIGVNDKSWGPMPRYAFNADNFNMWQYLTIHANWSNEWLRVPAAFNDVAHKNGVVTGCLYFLNWMDPIKTSGTNQTSLDFRKLTTKEGGEFKYARKFVEMMKYYGIDGISMDAEGSWNAGMATLVQDFFIKCHEIGEEIDWPFRVDWYSFVGNTGSLNDYSVLNSNCSDWFQKGGKPVSDLYFLNYNWNAELLATSVTTAQNLGRSPKDVYAGFNTQERGFGSSGARSPWSALAASDASFAMWGANDRSGLFGGCSEFGTSDLAVQNTYLKKSELLFTGGTRNVLNTPAITDAEITSGEASLKNFHGYSKVASAKSTITEIPFVTRFNLGNGTWFKKDGIVSFDHKWYNIGVQDYLPTWRWWISDDAGLVPENAIHCDLSFDDAWYGGSCLKVSGATTKSNVHLFKTKLTAAPTQQFSVTYKVNNGLDPKMKITLSKEGSEDVFSSVALPAASTPGKWQTKVFNLSEFGVQAGEIIACLGFTVENTNSNYEVLLGELSITDPAKTYAPVMPTITYTEALKRTYKDIDAKVIFQSSSIKAKADGTPVYNEEVDTWYFEVYIKQTGSDPVLVTTTTSWATYVSGAPLSNPEDVNYQIGIRAVAPDGKTFSTIAWTENMTSSLIPIETLTIDKPIIKPNQTFTLGFMDPLHENADFEIINSLTGATVYSQTGVKKVTTSLADLGCYDVKITSGGTPVITRSMIIITPIETGSLPEILSLSANKTTPAVNEQISLSYTANKGEGTVSQAIYLSDPKTFKVDKSILSGYPFTYSLWFKAEKLEHLSRGTILMQKVNKGTNYDGAAWVNSQWGEMWTVIRPAGMGLGLPENSVDYTTKNNEVSLNTWGGIGGSPYPHEGIVNDAVSKGYSITPGVWTHLAITMDASKKQCMYINGRKVFETTSTWASVLADTHFYVGGSAQNLGAFTGWIDEVQIWNKALTQEEIEGSMGGLFVAPAGLQGYFTFEEMNTDGTFPNLGLNSMVQSGSVIQWKSSLVSGSTVIRDEQQQATLTLGVPALEGVRNIVLETPKWTLPGATSSPVEGGATANYNANGKYSVTLGLTNSWGDVSKTLTDYIIVGTGTGLEDNKVTEDLSIYPIPFKERANIQFATAGTYVIEIFDVNAHKVVSETYEASAGDINQLSLNAPAGIYFVKVMKNGVSVRSFKVIKK